MSLLNINSIVSAIAFYCHLYKEAEKTLRGPEPSTSRFSIWGDGTTQFSKISYYYH